MSTYLSNASGLIALFNEDDLQLKIRALRQIAANIDNLWSEVSHLINDMYSRFCNVAYVH